MNKVFLSGVVKSIPGLKATNSGMQLIELPVTVSREWNGKTTEETIPVTFWSDRAERLITDLCVGDTVVIEARVSSRSWKGQDGEEKLFISVNGSMVNIIRGGKPQAQEARPAPPPQFGAPKQHTEMTAQEFLAQHDSQGVQEIPF